MNVKKFYLLIGIVLILGLLPQRNVSADMGPKPSMDFEFVQEISGEEISIVLGILYVCEKPDCSDAQPVIEKGIQGAYGFGCGIQSCNAQWGGNYFQLEITFSDGVTRKSNIFGKSFFNAKYSVTINDDSLMVEELEGYDTWGNFGKLINSILLIFGGIIISPLIIAVPIIFVRRQQGKSNLQLGACLVVFYMWLFAMWGLVQNYRAFLYTMFIELGIAFGYLLFRRIKMDRILFAIVAANAFTQPVFFFLVSRSTNVIFATIVGELLIWIVETAVVYFIQHKQLTFKHILALTFVLNVASFGFGLLLPA